MPRVFVLVLAALAAPALAQSAPSPPCDPAAAVTLDAAHACGDAVDSVARTRIADRAAVARIYAALDRGDLAAVASGLDDHVLWVGLGGRVFGRAAVAAHLASLGATPDALHVGPDGRVTATSRRPDGQAARAVWRLVHGLVVGIEHAVDRPAGDGQGGRLALDG